MLMVEKSMNSNERVEKRKNNAIRSLNNLDNSDKVKLRTEGYGNDLIKREFVRQIETHPEMLGNYTPKV